MEVRYFYAHSKGDPDESIDEAVGELTRLLGGAIAPKVAKVVPGRDDYNARARALGGWKAWQRSVAVGTDAAGAPLFSAYILPSVVLGRATAEIIRDALAAGKNAAVWTGGNSVAMVERVEKVSDSWTDGYRAVTR